MDIEAAKLIGAGLAVIGMIGSGIGIGNVFHLSSWPSDAIQLLVAKYSL